MPCVDPGIWALKWYFLPVVLLSSSIVLATALLVNNIQRQYPKFWFAPIPAEAPPKMQHRHRSADLPETATMEERQPRTDHGVRDFGAVSHA